MLVGEDPASAVYVGGKQRACAEVGMTPFDRRLPADATLEQVAEELEELNADERSAACCCSCRCPTHLDGPTLTGLIDPDKDVDGLDAGERRAAVAGAPGPAAVHAAGRDGAAGRAGVELEGAEAVVVGRSNLFGKPMAQLLLARERDRDRVPLAHARPARGVRPRRRPDRRRRAPAADRSASSSSRARS